MGRFKLRWRRDDGSRGFVLDVGKGGVITPRSSRGNLIGIRVPRWLYWQTGVFARKRRGLWGSDDFHCPGRSRRQLGWDRVAGLTVTNTWPEPEHHFQFVEH